MGETCHAGNSADGVEGEQAVYHVMSRTALDGFPFKDVEKDNFL